MKSTLGLSLFQPLGNFFPFSQFKWKVIGWGNFSIYLFQILPSSDLVGWEPVTVWWVEAAITLINWDWDDLMEVQEKHISIIILSRTRGVAKLLLWLIITMMTTGVVNFPAGRSLGIAEKKQAESDDQY